jgi:lipopolysaccharide cholinephosphotransferase
MRQLSPDELHQELFNIASCFADICEKNGIPYFMLAGTMLGAIRHHGFIPWDDDMDFGVPIEYYQQMLVVMEKQLPAPYECGTYLNNTNVQYPFAKIHNRNTYSDNRQQYGDDENKIGVNIDIFPLYSCDKNDPLVKKIYRTFDFYGRVFTNSSTGSKTKNLIKKILRCFVPGNRKSWCSYLERLSLKLGEGDYLANLNSFYLEKDVVPKEYFGKATLYDFNGTQFRGVEHYDKYLTHLYGDYMQLPPVEKRHFHSSNYYVID